jgi:hypothetical protein
MGVPFPGQPHEGSMLPPAPQHGEDPVYRPLSGFALAGFSLAAVYCAIVVVLAIVAVVARKPALMSGWWVLLPILAVALAVIGWLQIQSSEGTRTGRSLAGWAITLSLVVSLGYWAYYTAIFYVIRNQAQSYCMKFFDKLREGKVESAFLMALAPKQRTAMREDNPNLREIIEQRFNVESPGKKSATGGFTLFKNHLITYVIRQGGPDVQITPLGVDSWEFATDGYVVRQRYRIATPDMVLNALVVARSTESHGKELVGREWAVILQESTSEMSQLEPTDSGIRLLALARHAEAFLDQWKSRLQSPAVYDNVEDYFGTLSADQRKEVAQNVAPRSAALVVGSAGSGGWTAWGSAGAATIDLENRMPGYQAFVHGGLVKIDENFWPTNAKARQAALTEVRQVFHATAELPWGVMEVTPDRKAYWSRENDRVVFRRAVTFRVRTMLPSIEGEVQLACDPKVMEVGPTPDTWQILGITLTNQRYLPIGGTNLNQSPPGMGAGPQ